MTHIQFLAAFI